MASTKRARQAEWILVQAVAKEGINPRCMDYDHGRHYRRHVVSSINVSLAVMSSTLCPSSRHSAATNNTPTFGKFYCIIKDSMDGSGCFFFFFRSFVLGYDALNLFAHSHLEISEFEHLHYIDRTVNLPPPFACRGQLVPFPHTMARL